MIIALFALSIAMIVGGIASVVQGFPFVRLESGLAMTIAGATTASAGAVVLGLAVLARQVRGLLRRQGARPVPEHEPLSGPPMPMPMPMPMSMPVAPVATAAETEAVEAATEPFLQGGRRPILAGMAGLGAGAAGAAYLGSAGANGRSEPSFRIAPDAHDPAAAEPFAEPFLPDLLPEEAAPPPPGVAHASPEPEPPIPERQEPAFQAPAFQVQPFEEPIFKEPPAPIAPEPPTAVEIEANDADLFVPEPSPIASELRPALDTLPEPEAEPALAVVGTYVSGGNTYVMFSDGSIEAETPRGRFSFDSLDELKAFVEAGGESESRGAA